METISNMALELKNNYCQDGEFYPNGFDCLSMDCLSQARKNKVKRHKSSTGNTLFIFADGSVLEFYFTSAERGVVIYPIPEIRKQYGQKEPVM